MEQKTKNTFLEDEMTVMVEVIDAEQQVLFSDLTNKAKHTGLECVTAAVNKVRQRQMFWP